MSLVAFTVTFLVIMVPAAVAGISLDTSPFRVLNDHSPAPRFGDLHPTGIRPGASQDG